MYICEFCGRATTSSVVCECRTKPEPVGDGGPAYPVQDCGAWQCFGMSLRDWFATFAPQPTTSDIEHERQMDRARNPYNEGNKPPLRTYPQIVAALRYEYADSMLAERAKRGK